jgi:ketosteroid isomerase-like protein
MLDKGDFVFTLKSSLTEETLTATAPDKRHKPAGGEKRSGPRIVAEQPLVGRVNVRSDIDGAVFELAGHRFETTKNSTLVIGNVPVGKHEVRAIKAGYPHWSGQVIVEPNRTASLDIDLKSILDSSDTSHEAEIRRVLKVWQNAVNARDAETILSLYTDTAEIMTKIRGTPRVFSKDHFSEIIPKKLQWYENQGIKFKMDEISHLTIRENRAQAQVLIIAYRASEGYDKSEEGLDVINRTTGFFSLVKRENKWIIDNFRFEEL